MVHSYRRAVLVLVLLPLLASCGGLGGPSVRRGDIAPALSLKDMDGNQVSLGDFRGRPVLLNFWASWCPPCRSEMPELERAYAAGADDGLVILAVNALYQDDLNDVEEFVAEQKLTFPILLDSEGDVAVTYRVSTFPTSIFVDREGKIHLVQVGPVTQPFIESVLRDMEK